MQGIPSEGVGIGIIMSSNKHLILTLVMTAAAAVLLYFLAAGLKMDQTITPSALVNKPAPGFTVKVLQGEDAISTGTPGVFTLNDFAGRPFVVNFWGSWCPSCRAEARDLEEYWQTRGDKSILLLGVAMHDTVDQAMMFARRYGKTYPLALDTESMAIDYGVTGAPETFVVDAKGTIIERIQGPVTAKQLAAIEAKYLSGTKDGADSNLGAALDADGGNAN